MCHDAVLPVKISENLREGIFDQACFGQYGQFQTEKLGDIETDMLFREVCRNGGESKFLLLIRRYIHVSIDVITC